MAKNRAKVDQNVQKLDEKCDLWCDIQKVDEEQREVYGWAVTWTEDGQGETITKAAVEWGLDQYMKFANLREMHQPSAVGHVFKAEITDQGLYIGAKVSDDQAWKKVVEKTYKGFSVGGRAIEKQGTKITKLYMREISLADRPVNGESTITLFKADVDLEKTFDIPSKPLDPNSPEVQKNLGTYAISRLADLIGGLHSFREFIVAEERVEGDAEGPIPEMLTGVLKQLGRALRVLVKEEMAEIITGTPNDPPFAHGEDIQMAEMLTKEDVAGIVAAALRDRDQSAAAQETDRIQKAEAAELKKKLDQVLADNEVQKAEIAALKASPAPGRGVAGAASGAAAPTKEDDGNPEIAKAVMPVSDDPLELIKGAHKMGATLTAGGFVPFLRQ